jgi:hypothetical protein
MIKKLSTFVLSLFSLLFLLFLAPNAFADGIRDVSFDGTNYSIQGAVSAPDGTKGKIQQTGVNSHRIFENIDLPT